MRSLDLTSKILKDSSPALMASPIPPSGSISIRRFAAESGGCCFEEPAITFPPPSLPSPAEEQAGAATKAATNAATISAFFTGTSAPALYRPRRARLYDGRPRSYRRLVPNVTVSVVSVAGARMLWVRARRISRRKGRDEFPGPATPGAKSRTALDRALLDLSDLVGHEAVSLAVHGLSRLLVGG